MTASTLAPVSSACRTAQASAAFDDFEPSTPTTIRCCSLIFGSLPPWSSPRRWRTLTRQEQRHLAQGTGTLVPATLARRRLSELAQERVPRGRRGDTNPDIDDMRP